MATLAKPDGSSSNAIALLKNPHVWILGVITIFLVLTYKLWPWRDFQFQGAWQWFHWLYPLQNLAVFESFNRLIGCLFLIPIIYATIIFRLRGSIILTAVCVIAIYPLLQDMWYNLNSWITNIGFFLLPAILIIAINVEFRLRSRDKEFFIELEKERRAHLTKIIEAQETAKQRVARELHDESIQTLLAIASHTERLKFVDNITEIRSQTTWIEKNIRSTVEELRRICLDLRPKVLDDLGLMPALRWLIHQPILENSMHIQINIVGTEVKLSPNIELTVFRVVQEALNNIKDHAKATEAVINFRYVPDMLTISVQDNGNSFVVPRRLSRFALEGKLGLIGIQERIQSLGGEFSISSKKNTGTILSIEIPTVTISSHENTTTDSQRIQNKLT